jgi:tetratricopeptide (TPR) repeat protein
VRTPSIAGVLAAALLAACGGGAAKTQKSAAAPAPVQQRPAVPQAAAKLVAGAEAAKSPSGRERALSLTREAIAIDPQLWEGHYNLGVLLAQGGDLGGAEPSLERAAAIAPDVEEVAAALGQVRRQRGEHRKAAEGLKAYSERHPDATSVRALYVGALRDAGQIEEARNEAREILRRKAGDATALSELALCELAKGARDSADLLVKQALSSNKESAVAHRAAGLIALAKGDDAAAFGSFLKAAQLDPKDTTARLNMGTVLLRAGVYSKAEEQFRAVLAVSKEDESAAIGLAAALRGQGDKDRPGKFKESQKVLEGVLARDPHNIDAEFDLGVLLADFMKKPVDAKPIFQRFLADAPADHAARPEAERQLKVVGK